MANDDIKIILAAFVVLIVGIVLVSTVSSETLSRTTTLTTNNEYVDAMAANNGTGINASEVIGPVANLGDTNDDCLMTGVSISNSTGTNLTVTTHYVFDTSEGTFTLTNGSFPYLFADNTTNVTYTYCPSGYINLGWGRTTTNLVPGFFGLALVGVALWMFFSISRDWMKQ